MNALYFGSSKQPLFGAYNPPKVRRPVEAGVVLCAPMHQEYMRAHKALRQLAAHLSSNGFHVLRFDYFGTGDSGGHCEEGSLEQWIDDIGTAIDEIKDANGLKTVSLVGLRLGAALAAAAAARRPDVDKLVLWDPVVIGSHYLRQLYATAVRADGSGRRLTEEPAAEETVSVRGFPLTPQMRSTLRGLDVTALTMGAKSSLLIVSEEQEDYTALREGLTSTRSDVTYAHIPSPSTWENATVSGGDLVAGAMVLPQQMIKGIVGWFSGENQA